MSINLCFRSGKRFDTRGNPKEPFVEFDVWSVDKEAIEKIINDYPAFVGNYVLEKHTMTYRVILPLHLADCAGFGTMLRRLYDLMGG